MAESNSVHAGFDPLRLTEELEAALEQQELATLEDGGDVTEDTRAAATNLAVALGKCRLFGVSLSDELDGTLPLATARAAAEGLTRKLRQATEDARSLGQRWDWAENEIEMQDLVCGLLEDRMDAWAALEAIEESLNDNEPGRDRLVAAVDEAHAALLDFDKALEAEIGILSTVVDTNLLDNWRKMLAPEYKEPMPWWLDGTLEAEANRAYQDVLEWMPDAQEWARLRQLHATSGPTIPLWRPSVEPTLMAAAEAAEDQPYAPPLYWQSPDGRYQARVIFPPRLACPPDEPLALSFLRAENQERAIELAGEPVQLGVLSLTIDEQGRAAFVLAQLPDSETPPELRVGASATRWPRWEP